MDQARVISALALLKKINQAGYKSVICGGYVRDTICGKAIRDIDLYVCCEDYPAVRAFLTDDKGKYTVFEDTSPEYQHQAVVSQQEFELKNTLVADLPTSNVNLIGLRSEFSDKHLNVKSVIERFNLGICKAGIELSSGRIVIDDEFRRDYKDKQITLYRTDWGHEASLKQFIKLQAKYPWPLRVHQQPENPFNAV
jgi:hypothetical protein